MISLSPQAKAAYSKFVGPDGKLIIDENVPENLRETFQYFNDNDINILELNIEQDYTTLDEDLETEIDEDIDDDNTDIDFLDEDEEDSDIEESLEDFF